MSKYVKTPTVYQFEATECGAASLSMIFSFFGKYLPLEKLRIETGVSRDGCNAGNIMRCAKKYGLDCRGYRKDASALKSISLPCIIHWNNNHFVVFEGFKGKYAYINDPAAGRRRITCEELSDGFSGTVLTFSATEKFEKGSRKNSLVSYIKKTLKEEKGTASVLFLLSLGLVFPVVLLPLLIKMLTDSVFSGISADYDTAAVICLICTGFILQCVLSYYSDAVLLRLRKKTVLISAKELFHKLFRLPMAFFEQRYTGDLAGTVKSSSDVNGFVTGKLVIVFFGIFSSVACFVLLLIISPFIALIAVSSVILDIIVAEISSHILSDASVRFRQDSGILAGKVMAGIGITATIKASGAEGEYTAGILAQNEKAELYGRKLRRVRAINQAISYSLKTVFVVIMLTSGVLLIEDGKLTLGGLIACIMLFGVFSRPIRSFAGFSGIINTVKAEIGRVEDIMNYAYDDKFTGEENKRHINTKLEGSVELKDISFGYSALKPPVVSELSFRVECGSSIAVVGTSGSGKSTVSKIISGLYKPQEGQLFFDDIPSCEIPDDVISASISTVSQKITLFSGTVRDNLTMWNSSISEADMIAAAKDACIHDVISQKPGAYDHQLSEGAGNLSGGQRQRLEIARALATNPTVLIMDEATSALDSVTEKEIMDNIKRRGCTCIVIAHRLSAIRDCDNIAVMDKGRIVQYGPHALLKEEEGIYRKFISEL